MHDVAIRESGVLATQEARVLLIHEETEMPAQPAMLVAHPLRERRVRADQCLERLAQRRRLECDIARSTRETAVRAVEKYSHMSTTNGRSQLRQA